MRVYLFLFTFFFASFSHAQYFEVGARAGVSNYLGDLTPSSLWVSFGDVQLHSGFFVRYNFIEWVSIRGGINYGKIGAADANAVSEPRRKRNISFRSNIFEIELSAEINLLGYQPYKLRKRFAPYIFGGIAFFKFNPQAQLNGQWYDLQPLSTEGQGMEGRPSQYNLTQLSIPMGIGFKYAVTEYWTIGLELTARYTFTDYLDDVSTNYVDRNELIAFRDETAANLANRTGEYLGTEPVNNPGEPRGGSNRDWYSWSGITVTYNFMDGFGGNKYGCPTNF